MSYFLWDDTSTAESVMDPLDRKLRNLKQMAQLQGCLPEVLFDQLTKWIKKLCHTTKSRDEV